MSDRREPPEVTFVHPTMGAMPGYVVGFCGHRIAVSEWRSGFRVCERCFDGDYQGVADAVKWLSGVSLAGSLTWRRAADLLADWEHRCCLREYEVQLILARYPDPDDYERQVSQR